jgi:hypothetical protein
VNSFDIDKSAEVTEATLLSPTESVITFGIVVFSKGQ